MDPNATLQMLRELALEILANEGEQSQIAVDIADAFNNLDHWIIDGGLLPGAWER